MDNPDYRKYCHLERYLFENVSESFKKNNTLSAHDFFCIIIWKANRAKSRVTELLSKDDQNLEDAVSALTREIAKADNEKAKLQVLVSNWKF